MDRFGRLVGIVSRGDLLRAFLRPDREIEQEIRDQVTNDQLRLEAATLTVGVPDGVVSVTGSIESQLMMENLLEQICRVGGVVGIRNDLAVLG